MTKKRHRQLLIDMFVNRIYLYDDKLVITFNHKDGAETITLEDIETALAEAGFGSDLVSFAVPKRGRPYGRPLFCYPRKGLEDFNPTARWAVRHRQSRRRCILTMCLQHMGNESLPVYPGQSTVMGDFMPPPAVSASPRCSFWQ